MCGGDDGRRWHGSSVSFFASQGRRLFGKHSHTTVIYIKYIRS